MIVLPVAVIECLIECYAEGITQSTTPAVCDLAFGMAVGFNTTLQLTGAIDKERNVELYRRFELTYFQHRAQIMETEKA